MDIITAMEQRHSVRSYSMTPLSEKHAQAIQELIVKYNEEAGLHMQLIINEPKAFQSPLAKYGHFEGVLNYIVLAGSKTNKKLDELCGYYGEMIVLRAQQMGLNTCWVAGTYKKIEEAYDLQDGEKIVAVIAIGYGNNSGKSHKSKTKEHISNVDEDSPVWFKRGLKYALLAPTAMNQQKFKLILFDNTVEAIASFGPYTKLDLGIVKCHFELGAEKENFTWK